MVDLVKYISPEAYLIVDLREYDKDLEYRLKRQNPESYYLAAKNILGGQIDCIIYKHGDENALLKVMPFLNNDGHVICDMPDEEAGKELAYKLQQLGIHPYAADPYYKENGDIEGFILRAVKGEKEYNPLFIQTIIGEKMVCSRVRVTEPQTMLNTIPLVQAEEYDLLKEFKLDFENERTKILLRQRAELSSKKELKRIMDLLEPCRYLMIAEIDDDPLRWADRHRANDFIAFRGCHAVQVSTPALADFMSQFNPNVKCFANQLAYLPEKRHDETGEIKVFFGALNREADWMEYIGAINKIADKYKGKIHFQIIYDKQFFDSLATDDKSFSPFCSYPEYERFLHESHIAWLPLADNHFNRMKSDLKFIECAGHGVATIASPIVYAGTIEDGKTGCIYHDKYEFEAYFSKLIEDDEFRNTIRHNAYDYVKKNRMLYQHYRERYEWYHELYAKFTDLHDELKKRVGLDDAL